MEEASLLLDEKEIGRSRWEKEKYSYQITKKIFFKT